MIEKGNCRNTLQSDFVKHSSNLGGSGVGANLPVCLPTYLCACLPTCVPASLPTSLPPYLPTSLPYLPPSLPAYLASLPASLHTYLPPSLPTYPPYQPTHLSTYLPASGSSRSDNAGRGARPTSSSKTRGAREVRFERARKFSRIASLSRKTNHRTP